MAKKKLTRKKWAKTNREISEFMGISAQAFHKSWRARDGFPEKTKLGWPVAACLAFVKKAKDEKISKPDEKNGDLRSRELELKCQVLEERLAKVRGSTITFDEHLSELQDYGHMLNAALDQLVNEVTSLISDPKSISIAKKIRTRVRSKLMKAILNAQAPHS